MERTCPNQCSSFIDATPSYLQHPLVPKRMYNTFLPNQRQHVRFIAVLREPASRDLSWFSVGEGIRTKEWWQEKRKKCGGSINAAAKCYEASVKEEIHNWRTCMGDYLSIYSLNCKSNPSSCLQLLASSEAVLAEVYETCSKNNRIALGIYAGKKIR